MFLSEGVSHSSPSVPGRTSTDSCRSSPQFSGARGSTDHTLFLRWCRGRSCFLSSPPCRLGSRGYRNGWVDGQRHSCGQPWTAVTDVITSNTARACLGRWPNPDSEQRVRVCMRACVRACVVFCIHTLGTDTSRLVPMRCRMAST